MLMALALLSWWGALIWSFGPRARTGAWLMALAGVAAVYTHATGFLIPFSAAVFSFLVWVTSPTLRPRLKSWALVHALVAAASLPAVANSWIRSVGHMSVPDAGEVARTLARLLLDQAAVQHPVLLGLGLVLVAGAFVGAWWSSLRWSFVGYVLAPVLLLLAASYLFRPIWHFRPLYPLTPFLILGVAVLLVRVADLLGPGTGFASRGVRWVPAALVVGLLVVLSVRNAVLHEKTHHYPEAVAFVQQHQVPGDIVWAPHFVTAWAVKRYWIGPRWGSITRVQGDPSSEQWRRVYDRLGVAWLERIGLAPETRSIAAGDIWIYTGPGVDDAMRAQPRIWVVDHQPEQAGDPLRADGYVLNRTQDFRGVGVAEFVIPRPLPNPD